MAESIGVPNCGNCKYFFSDRKETYVLPNGTLVEGACRRFPPTNKSGIFAGMFRDEWCGEHQERPVDGR